MFSFWLDHLISEFKLYFVFCLFTVILWAYLHSNMLKFQFYIIGMTNSSHHSPTNLPARDS